MNPRPCRSRPFGITLLEVMVLLTAMIMTAVLVLPQIARSRARPNRIGCVNNLKQVGLSFQLWSVDNHDKFPMALAMTNGGTMDHPLAYKPSVHLGILSNEINTPTVLACPEDQQVAKAMNFGRCFGNGNVSYFVAIDTADGTQPQMILTGDRNLTSSGVAIHSGLYALDANATHGWSKGLHNDNGTIGLADGSVQQMSSAGLRQYLQAIPQTNRLAIP